MADKIRSFIENSDANSNGLNAAPFSVASNLEKYEAARSGFFTLTISDLDNVLSPEAWGQTGSTFARAQEAISLSVTKCNIPHFSITPLEYKRGNEKIKFAGTPEFDSGSITVDDIVGLETKNILMAWQGLAYNVKTRKGGRMKDYKKTATLTEYTQDYEPIRSWTLYGCWISKLDEEAFDRENDGARKITAAIEYDRAVMEVEDDYLNMGV